MNSGVKRVELKAAEVEGFGDSAVEGKPTHCTGPTERRSIVANTWCSGNGWGAHGSSTATAGTRTSRTVASEPPRGRIPLLLGLYAPLNTDELVARTDCQTRPVARIRLHQRSRQNAQIVHHADRCIEPGRIPIKRLMERIQ